MEKYIKDGVIKNKNRIVVKNNNSQIINPSHESLILDGWQLYEPVVAEPTPEELLARAKRVKSEEIKRYDSSNSVNLFYVSGVPVWLDKTTRTGLMLRFEAEEANGNTETSLWYNGIQIPLTLDRSLSGNAFQMLYALEVYASQCYDNTQYHLAQINNMDDIDVIKNYDHTVGYPEKLRF